MLSITLHGYALFFFSMSKGVYTVPVLRPGFRSIKKKNQGTCCSQPVSHPLCFSPRGEVGKPASSRRWECWWWRHSKHVIRVHEYRGRFFSVFPIRKPWSEFNDGDINGSTIIKNVLSLMFSNVARKGIGLVSGLVSPAFYLRSILIFYFSLRALLNRTFCYKIFSERSFHERKNGNLFIEEHNRVRI